MATSLGLRKVYRKLIERPRGSAERFRICCSRARWARRLQIRKPGSPPPGTESRIRFNHGWTRIDTDGEGKSSRLSRRRGGKGGIINYRTDPFPTPFLAVRKRSIYYIAFITTAIVSTILSSRWGARWPISLIKRVVETLLTWKQSAAESL